VTCSKIDFTGNYCVTGSTDRTAILWDIGTGKLMEQFRGHEDEIYDAQFNMVGTKIVTASADKTARVYNVNTGACIGILMGHTEDVNKALFNP